MDEVSQILQSQFDCEDDLVTVNSAADLTRLLNFTPIS